MLQLLHNSDVDKMPIVTQNNVATKWEQRYFQEQRKPACYAEPKYRHGT